MRLLPFSVAALLAFAPCMRAARADTPAATESDEDRKAAAKLFAEGQKSYSTGDFRHAAESFEAAYARAPRLAPLWNAARAWHKARELVRAANLYAKYLKLAPPSAPDRNSATAAMRELEPKLARLEIHASGFDDVKLDGVAVEGIDDQGQATVFVTPGSHVLEGASHGKHATKTVDAPAGASSSVLLHVEPEVAPPPPPPPVALPEEKHKGWSPIVVAVGGGLTAVSAGILIWSGVDTLDQRSTFDAARTQQNLDDGKSKQLRTNVMIGVTAGLAALTAVAAIFLVDWKGHSAEARVGVGPGSLTFGGSF